MPTFDLDTTTISAFEIDDSYLFTPFFEDQDLFGKLREYYNDEQDVSLGQHAQHVVVFE